MKRYTIRENSRRGFFAKFFTVLEQIHYHESPDAKFKVLWDGGSYFDSRRGPNAWEYYFAPVQSFCDWRPDETARIEQWGSSLEDKLIYHDLIKRFIRIRSSIVAKADSFSRAEFHNSTEERLSVLGVHLRRTDHDYGGADAFHAGISPVTNDEFFEHIDVHLANHPVDRIFVATDSLLALDAVSDRYGRRVVHYDALRSPNTTSIQGDADVGIEGDPYKKGADAVVECLLLSRCDYLVRGTSNLSAAACCFNPFLPVTDLSLIYGRNNNHQTWVSKACNRGAARPRSPHVKVASQSSILHVPAHLQPPSHWYGDSDGPWIERCFYDYWQKRRGPAPRTHIPIFWTDYYARHGHRPHQTIQRFLDQHLRPDIKYFTVVQNDDGVLEDLPRNVLVFAAGGEGHVPIPLLKQNAAAKITSACKDIFASFIGGMHGPHDRTGVRSKMKQVLRGVPGLLIDEERKPIDEYLHMLDRSVFALCPRGYGRSSFRLYEALARRAIPIYIWDDKRWLPYDDVLDWSEFSVCLNVDDISDLPAILANHNQTSKDRMREATHRVFQEFFSFDGVCRQIDRMLHDDYYTRAFEDCGWQSPRRKFSLPRKIGSTRIRRKLRVP